MKKCMVVFGVVIGMMVSLQVNAQSVEKTYYEDLADYYSKVVFESLQKELLIGTDSLLLMNRMGAVHIPSWLTYSHKIDSKEVQFNLIKEKQAQLEKRICNLQNELITDIILDVIKILLLIVVIIVLWRRSIKKK